MHPTREERRRPLSATELERLRGALGNDIVQLSAWPLVGGIDTATYGLEARLRSGDAVRMVLHCYRRWEPSRAADRIERERLLLDAIAPYVAWAPQTLLTDGTGELLGDPASVLTFLPGVPLPPPRAGGERALWIEEFARPLVEMHRIGRDRLPAGFRVDDPAGDLDRAVDEAHDDELSRALVAALRRTAPPECGAPVLLHHDYWYGNTLWSDGHLTGVIDWISARLGDPQKDLALARCDVAVTCDLRATDELADRYHQLGGAVGDLRFWDLLWALVTHRWLDEWLIGYADLGLPDLTLAEARARIAAFAERALRDQASGRT